MNIPKGLKAGDTFKDGGFTFKVEAVNQNGTYLSKRIGKAEITKPEVKQDEPKEEVTKEVVNPSYTKTEINRSSVEKLESICKELGLKVGTGLSMKQEIIKKLGL